MFFKPFKTPGMDGIFKILAPILCRIFRPYIVNGHILTAWKYTKIIFTPKIGKDNYFEFNLFRRLTSFLLKVKQKLADRCNREIVMSILQLSYSHHAYQLGRSTDTVLYCLSSILEKTLYTIKKLLLQVSWILKMPLIRFPVQKILRDLKRKNIDDTMIN